MTFRTLLIALLCGCGGQTVVETGNPSAALVAYSRHEAVSFDNTGELQVEEAWVSLSEIRVLPEGSCSDPDSVTAQVPGPLAVNLLDAERVDLPFEADERFCGLQVNGPAASQPSDAPPELASANFVVIGRRTSDGAPVRIARNIESSTLLQIEDPGTEFTLTGAHLLAWDLGSILQLDIEIAVPNSDGVIEVNVASNMDLLEDVAGGSFLPLNFFVDLDADGVADDEDVDRAPLAKTF